jgi:putative membrane protein
MKKLICFLSIVMVLFFVSSCKNNKHAKNYNEMIDEGSVSFIQQGLEAGQTEIKASQLAAANSKNPHVLSFARSIIMDYDTTNDRLEKIAINNRVRGGDSVSARHQKAIANITSLSGNAFDKAYIQFMVTEHQNVVKLYNAATNDRLDAIQTFARRALPVLKMHLDSANLICATLK